MFKFLIFRQVFRGNLPEAASKLWVDASGSSTSCQNHVGVVRTEDYGLGCRVYRLSQGLLLQSKDVLVDETSKEQP